jgi:uncharacterized Zn finger protein
MIELKQEYNKIAEQQRAYLEKIKNNKFPQETPEEFTDRGFGLSEADFCNMLYTKEMAERAINQLANEGIQLTPEEVINGFKED